MALLDLLPTKHFSTDNDLKTVVIKVYFIKVFLGTAALPTMADINLPSISYVLMIGSKCVSVIENGVSFILGNPDLYSPYKITTYRETKTSEIAHNFLNYLVSADTA